MQSLRGRPRRYRRLITDAEPEGTDQALIPGPAAEGGRPMKVLTHNARSSCQGMLGHFTDGVRDIPRRQVMNSCAAPALAGCPRQLRGKSLLVTGGSAQPCLSSRSISRLMSASVIGCRQ